MNLLVQEFLKTNTLKELQEQHGVYASFSKSGHKASFNYDQIEAKESDLLAQECRGLILSAIDGHSFLPQAITINDKLNYDHIIMGETEIIAFGMKRFFNYGQGSAAQINWSDPKLAVLEKLDGTLCQVYYDKFTSQWHVSTRAVPEADLLMDNGLFTFRTLFEKALKDTCGHSFEDFTFALNKKITYCFELTTPYNRIVVNYNECRVTLLAARKLYGDQAEFELQSLKVGKSDLSVEPFHIKGVPVVQAHKYTSVSELLDWVSSLNPLDHEGVVVLDSNFNRIKVKNAAYVAFNKLHDRLGSSERNCMEFILLEKDDDVVSFLPEEIVNNMSKLKEGFQKALINYDNIYNSVKLKLKELELEDNKKEFALLINSHKDLWTAPFFAINGGKASSMKDFIQKNRKVGTWADSFIDKIIDITKKASVS